MVVVMVVAVMVAAGVVLVVGWEHELAQVTESTLRWCSGPCTRPYHNTPFFSRGSIGRRTVVWLLGRVADGVGVSKRCWLNDAENFWRLIRSANFLLEPHGAALRLSTALFNTAPTSDYVTER